MSFFSFALAPLEPLRKRIKKNIKIIQEISGPITDVSSLILTLQLGLCQNFVTIFIPPFSTSYSDSSLAECYNAQTYLEEKKSSRVSKSDHKTNWCMTTLILAFSTRPLVLPTSHCGDIKKSKISATGFHLTSHSFHRNPI